MCGNACESPLLIGRLGKWRGLYEEAIDDIRLYRGALAEEEVRDNLADKVAKERLVSWWRFEGNANDSVGGQNHGTIMGTPRWVVGRRKTGVTTE